mmetsp:Transcript_48263/g.137104  ORF Transcript_48263/g.137104 Transcript_48263/m.137104 type:complete len:249 (-) Transcript_48263:58-804(-)
MAAVRYRPKLQTQSGKCEAGQQHLPCKLRRSLAKAGPRRCSVIPNMKLMFFGRRHQSCCARRGRPRTSCTYTCRACDRSWLRSLTPPAPTRARRCPRLPPCCPAQTPRTTRRQPPSPRRSHRGPGPGWPCSRHCRGHRCPTSRCPAPPYCRPSPPRRRELCWPGRRGRSCSRDPWLHPSTSACKSCQPQQWRPPCKRRSRNCTWARRSSPKRPATPAPGPARPSRTRATAQRWHQQPARPKDGRRPSL